MQREPSPLSVADLISISSAPPVVSLAELESVRCRLCEGGDAHAELTAMLGQYCLDDPDTRAAVEVILTSLARPGLAGDAFHVQGVYGSGKSHLLAALTLLCGHPKAAWPVFLASHPAYEKLAEQATQPRLVAAIALDEYPSRSHPLEHIVLSRLETELAARHGVTVALTEQSYLLELVEQYVAPQVGGALDDAARATTAMAWEPLREQDPEQAAQVALAFIEQTGFPLDWRRSRAEAWAELTRALTAAGVDGVVVMLDELGLFLAGKDRSGLNADASFLQWLAQRTAGARGWLIVTTQRGFDDVGDIDRRTLRQLRDRFRAGLTLDLSDLGWVLRHKVAPRRAEEPFAEAMIQFSRDIADCVGEEALSAADLQASYPMNPLTLEVFRRAAETWLSRTRSAVRLLQEATARLGWLDLPAHRLITPEVLFDLSRDELAMTAAGRRHLDAFEAIMANAGRIARGEEARLAVVAKTLCLLGVSDLRWSDRQLRAALVGGEEAGLWQETEAVRSLLQALYLRSGYVERVHRDESDEYWLDLSSEVSEEIRRRLGELLAELSPHDSRVTQAALEACREPGFPLASLAESRSLGVRWLHTKRLVQAECRDLHTLNPEQVGRILTSLEHPLTREDAHLFLASPLGDPSAQERAWLEIGAGLHGRFTAGLAAWLPAPLSDLAVERLVEHAALTLMVTDRTFGRRKGDDARQRLRERWAASEVELRAMLQRAYHEGKVIGANGRDLVERERLWALFGDWESALTAIFSASFQQLFPKFHAIAPQQPLTTRLHTNQIVDQFVRPGEVTLPPASTLESHLLAYAAPLGLVEAEGRCLRLALRHDDLVQAALAETPGRSEGEEIDPAEVIAVGDFVGRLAKGEWGLTREQGELLLAALLRMGHLAGLDAFLLPVRLDQLAAPLGDHLPFVARGLPLAGLQAEVAQALCFAASGEPAGVWDLTTQERSWSFFRPWADRLRSKAAQWSETLTRTAVSFGHEPADWDWARAALARVEILAKSVDGGSSSTSGLRALATAAERLPGGIEGACKALTDWRECEQFLTTDAARLAALSTLITQVVLPREGELLARDRQLVRAQFTSSRPLVEQASTVIAASERWLAGYRRHYLAWHARVHAAAPFEPLLARRRSPGMALARQLAQAGLGPEGVAKLDNALAHAIGLRCLAGDPLPPGSIHCLQCGIALGQELALPNSAETEAHLHALCREQRLELRAHAGMLRRRATATPFAEAISLLTAGDGDAAPGRADTEEKESTPTELTEVLTNDVVAWLREQLAQPAARQRSLDDLAARLRGRELARSDVIRIVTAWLGEGETAIAVI